MWPKPSWCRRWPATGRAYPVHRAPRAGTAAGTAEPDRATPLPFSLASLVFSQYVNFTKRPSAALERGMRKPFAGLWRHGPKGFRGGTAFPYRPLPLLHPHQLHRHSAGNPRGAGTELRGPEGAAERGPPRPSGRRGGDPIPLRGWGSSAPRPPRRRARRSQQAQRLPEGTGQIRSGRRKRRPRAEPYLTCELSAWGTPGRAGREGGERERVFSCAN